MITALTTAARKRHAAVLLVTHNDAVAARADRIVTLRDGHVGQGFDRVALT